MGDLIVQAGYARRSRLRWTTQCPTATGTADEGHFRGKDAVGDQA
jgi:hypothetical protein